MPMERRLESMGRAEVLKLFPLNAKVKTVVAGLNVTRGKLDSVHCIICFISPLNL